MRHARSLVQAWKNFEEEHGTEETLQQVRKMMPKRVKRRRKIVTDDGVSRDVEMRLIYTSGPR